MNPNNLDTKKRSQKSASNEKQYMYYIYAVYLYDPPVCPVGLEVVRQALVVSQFKHRAVIWKENTRSVGSLGGRQFVELAIRDTAQFLFE